MRTIRSVASDTSIKFLRCASDNKSSNNIAVPSHRLVYAGLSTRVRTDPESLRDSASQQAQPAENNCELIVVIPRLMRNQEKLTNAFSCWDMLGDLIQNWTNIRRRRTGHVPQLIAAPSGLQKATRGNQ